MDRQSNSDAEPYFDDVSDIEYDEHGNPTPAQIQRWEELRAAAANKCLNEVNETIAEVRREYAAKIAAGIDPGPHLISVEELRAAGALDVPPAWRKSLSAGCERDLPLFRDLIDEDDEDSGNDQPAPHD
jgi:hypothetical protein